MRFLKPLLLCASLVALSATIHAAPQDRTKDAVKGTKAIDPPVANPVLSRAEPASKKPIGVWTREVTASGGKVKVTITVKEDRLMFVYGEKLSTTYFMLDCDYGVTKDYVLFGVVNSVDGDTHERPTDKPFRLRYRIDEDALTIKDVSIESCPGIVTKFEGRYTLSKK